MELEHVQRLAQAFAQGVAFARGFTEMAQDAKDGEEDGHWVTIGGERGADGEKHGGRPVFISGSGTIKKGLSKSAQGKTLGQVFGKGGEFSSEGEKSKGETDRKAGERTRAGKEAGERASTKRAKAEKDRKDATSRAKEFRQETKQIVTNDLEPSVAKLKKALDANVPASVHDDLVDMHRLADQIGIMANKLCSLNSRWAENSKEPSAFVVSSHGQNAKGTAERVAKLARQSAAIAQDFGKPNNERSYPGLYAHDKIRDNLSELRGLHQDLLDHIRRIQEPEKQDEPQEDPLYAARGKMINGPARANATARATREPSSREVPKSFDLSTKEIKDLALKMWGYTYDRIGSYEFGQKLQDMANLSAEIDKMDKRYSFPMVQQNLEEARQHLGLAAREVRLMDDYQRRGAIPSLRSEISRRMDKANRLYREAKTEIDREQRRY